MTITDICWHISGVEWLTRVCCNTTLQILPVSGANGHGIQTGLVIEDQFTGWQMQLMKIDGSDMIVPEAQVHVSSPYFTGEIKAAVMAQPVLEVILVNAPGVRNFPY